MENQRLLEIRNSLASLPVLQNKLEKLNKSISDAEYQVTELSDKLKKESFDVEKMQKDTLSTSFLKFIGKYEGKIDKEMKEMLCAKMEYDRAAQRVKDLVVERDELKSRISSLNSDKQAFLEELRKREERITSDFTTELSLKYRQLSEKQESLYQLLTETDEALRAARSAQSTANSAMEYLESADNWATYDVWVKGGIISHMAKYEHMDNAQYEFNRLSSQLKDLEKELADVQLLDTFEVSEISTTTRAIDFWFDNIFTDLSVRDKIRDNMDELNSLLSRLLLLIGKLEDKKFHVSKEINAIEQQKIDLKVSME